MTLKNNSLGINSILIAISTSLISNILHESAHYLIAKYFNLNPELHHNYVKTLIEPSDKQLMFIALAGPTFSLIIGIILLFIAIKFITPSLLKLFLLWFGMSNILNFLGYILIAPFINDGDTGRVFNYIKIPFFLSIIIAVITFLITKKLFQYLSKEFIYYKNAEIFDKKENQKQLLIFPMIFLIIGVSLLNFPIAVWFSLLPTVFVPMTYLSTIRAYKKIEIIDAELTINKISITLLILTTTVIIIFRNLI
jgi:hypothetical protein